MDESSNSEVVTVLFHIVQEIEDEIELQSVKTAEKKDSDLEKTVTAKPKKKAATKKKPTEPTVSLEFAHSQMQLAKKAVRQYFSHKSNVYVAEFESDYKPADTEIDILTQENIEVMSFDEVKENIRKGMYQAEDFNVRTTGAEKEAYNNWIIFTQNQIQEYIMSKFI